MRVTIWGTRGSLASPGPETARYGGNTSCVEVRDDDSRHVLILDAGTGIRRLGASFPPVHRVDVLLTHLHMDHIQGLGFFAPLYDAAMQVHLWGPASPALALQTRLSRYLSPPLFPVHLRDLACRLELHDVPSGEFAIGPFRVTAALICHPGPTVGYRVSCAGATMTYLSDHEPALGVASFPDAAEWTSGYALAADADLLIHDGQYGADEYDTHVGWGHSSIEDAVRFAALAGAKRLVTFHHDPAHTDDDLERLHRRAIAALQPPFPVEPAAEGAVYELGAACPPQPTAAA
ncbi:MAG: MBL fold metallo-hydrolase [Candidatus Binatia bacterium]